MTRRILLTGASGQVGTALRPLLATLGQVMAPSRAELDLSHPLRLATAVRALKPDLIINPAAYTAVDKAESEPALCHLINAEAPAELAKVAHDLGIPLVHYSSDYVFDGKKSAPYLETDDTAPLNQYGASKRDAEQAIMASDCAHLILRTSWVYGAGGQNFVASMHRLLQERDQLKVVVDQVGAPTWSRQIAQATVAVLKIFLDHQTHRQTQSGIYHLSQAGQTSWFGFAQRIRDGLAQRDSATPWAALLPIPTTDYPTPAVRSRYSVLSNQKIQSTFGVQLLDWKAAYHLAETEFSNPVGVGHA